MRMLSIACLVDRRPKSRTGTALQRLDGRRAHFTHDSFETVDAVVMATGYRVDHPFLGPRLLAAEGRRLPLYRRIVPRDLPGLYLAGFVDAPGGLLPVVETPGRLDRRRRHRPGPRADRMRRLIGPAERRTRQRFPAEPAASIRCDPYALPTAAPGRPGRGQVGRRSTLVGRTPSITAAA